MWYQITSYVRFLLKSKNQHGVHSPFVYDLITTCFYDKHQYPAYSILSKYRSQLLNDHESIKIKDFGAGSRVFKSDQRKISAIAKNAGISIKRQKFLYRMVKYFKPTNVLELGTSLGIGTIALTIANPSATIITIEGCPQTSSIAQRYFDKYDLKNIKLKNITFEEYFSKYPANKIDFAYIDGNHHKKNTLHYFEILLERVSNDSVIIFDDIYWSAEMTEAWILISKHPKVTVSIDTFYWGIVFFRREQEKEHFTIRL